MIIKTKQQKCLAELIKRNLHFKLCTGCGTPARSAQRKNLKRIATQWEMRRAADRGGEHIQQSAPLRNINNTHKGKRATRAGPAVASSGNKNIPLPLSSSLSSDIPPPQSPPLLDANFSICSLNRCPQRWKSTSVFRSLIQAQSPQHPPLPTPPPNLPTDGGQAPAGKHFHLLDSLQHSNARQHFLNNTKLCLGIFKRGVFLLFFFSRIDAQTSQVPLLLHSVRCLLQWAHLMESLKGSKQAPSDE